MIPDLLRRQRALQPLRVVSQLLDLAPRAVALAWALDPAPGPTVHPGQAVRTPRLESLEGRGGG